MASRIDDHVTRHDDVPPRVGGGPSIRPWYALILLAVVVGLVS
jgi:hypothetical protein